MAADKINVDPETLAKLLKAIRSTWNMIAQDCEGESMSNRDALEVTIDANRVAMYGGKDAKEMDKLISTLCEKHGYSRVQKYLLSKVGQLV